MKNSLINALSLRRSVSVCAVMVLALAIGGVTHGTAARADSCQSSGNYYVVASAPLKNVSTGVSSWSYGYVQLWYSATCNVNWTRMVVEVPGYWRGAIKVETYADYPYGDSNWFDPTTVPPNVVIVGDEIDGTLPACSAGAIQNASTLAVAYSATVAQAGAPPC